MITSNALVMLFVRCIANLIKKPEPENAEVITVGIVFAQTMMKRMKLMEFKNEEKELFSKI